jgi:DNA-directed RNA polymerase subunit N (RpoN/RPB10)
MKEVYNQNGIPDITLQTRCTSCNKTIGHMEFRWLEEMKKIEDKEPNKNKIIMQNLGLKRECCRKDVLSHMKYVLKI